MSNGVPELFWFLLVGGAILLTIGAITCGFMLEHRRRMRALDILQLYAQQGLEPPASITERLAEQILAPEKSPSLSQQRRGALMQGFTSMVYAACATWGIAWWLTEDDGARWAIIAMTCGTVFFGISAAGMLLGALTTYARDSR